MPSIGTPAPGDLFLRSLGSKRMLRKGSMGSLSMGRFAARRGVVGCLAAIDVGVELGSCDRVRVAAGGQFRKKAPPWV